MRILQIHPLLRGDCLSPVAGGKSRVSLQLTCYLAAGGHALSLFPYPERLFDVPGALRLPNGFTATLCATAVLPTRRSLGANLGALMRARLAARRLRGENGSFDLLALEALRRALAENHPEIVHCHHTFSDLPFLYRAISSRAPLILTHHAYRPAARLDMYDWVIFVSRRWQREVVKQTGFPVERTRVIHNPVADAFTQGEIVPAQDRRGVTFLGNLIPRKGLALLLQAYVANADLREHPLTICGTGDALAEYRALAERHNLPVEFRGRLAAEEVRQVLMSSCALVVPSQSEGFSVAMLEALCTGTPVVGWGPQVEELESILDQPVGGALSSGTSADSLARKTLEVVERVRRRQIPLETIARRARVDFSIEQAGTATLRLYREAQAGPV
jgi:glycosyltransferase involved in cell wall biosynthesis